MLGGEQRDVAAALAIGKQTARTHLKSIRVRLGLGDRSGSLAAALLDEVSERVLRVRRPEARVLTLLGEEGGASPR